MSVSSSPLLLPNRFTLKPPNPRPIPVLFRRRTEVFVASMAGNRNPRPLVWNRVVVADKEKEQQCSSISSTIDLARNLVFRRSPEGALLFLLFVISTVIYTIRSSRLLTLKSTLLFFSSKAQVIFILPRYLACAYAIRFVNVWARPGF